MKAPLVPVALVYAAGLLAGHLVEVPIAAAFIITSATVVAAMTILVAMRVKQCVAQQHVA